MPLYNNVHCIIVAFMRTCIYLCSVNSQVLTLKGHSVRNRTFGHARPAKILISLRIRAVSSEPSLGTLWLAKWAKFLRADNEDSDQTARMRRLIGVFIGRRCQRVHFLTLLVRYRSSYVSALSYQGLCCTLILPTICHDFILKGK